MLIVGLPWGFVLKHDFELRLDPRVHVTFYVYIFEGVFNNAVST